MDPKHNNQVKQIILRYGSLIIHINHVVYGHTMAFFIFIKFKEDQCVFYPKDHCKLMKTFETNHVVYTHTYEGGMIMTIYPIIWLKSLLFIYIYRN